MTKSMRPQNLKLALKADSGLAVGQFYPLTMLRSILGRSVDVAVPVDDAKVSRNHAAIDIQNGFYMLADLGSTNGTYLNGQRVEQAEFLSPGDEIRVGSAVFLVELQERARALAGKNWREPTCVIFSNETKAERVVEALEAAHAPSDEALGEYEPVVPVTMPAPVAPQPPARHKILTNPNLMRVAGNWKRVTEQHRLYGRWLAIAVSLALTVAAIALRMG